MDNGSVLDNIGRKILVELQKDPRAILMPNSAGGLVFRHRPRRNGFIGLKRRRSFVDTGSISIRPRWGTP